MPKPIPVTICTSDLRSIILYLEDAARLYDALSRLPMQKCASRAHMINQLITKLKKIPTK